MVEGENVSLLTNDAGYLTTVGDTDIVAGAIDGGAGGEIADNTITADDLAADSVGSSELASSGVTAAMYGSGTQVPQIVIDEDGRITSASNVAITDNWVNTAGDTMTGSLTINDNDGVDTDVGLIVGDANEEGYIRIYDVNGQYLQLEPTDLSANTTISISGTASGVYAVYAP